MPHHQGNNQAHHCAAAGVRGFTVCIVGEWRGHTGDDALTESLLRGFTMQQRIALPNWTDTAHELTIWRRRAEHVATASEQTELRGSDEDAQDSMPSTAAEPAPVRRDRSTADGDAMRLPAANGTNGGALVSGPREPLQCWTCGDAPQTVGGPAPATDAAKGRRELRRCRFCRDAAFCSAACAADGQDLHRQAHALRLIFFADCEPDFASDVDYEPMPAL